AGRSGLRVRLARRLLLPGRPRGGLAVHLGPPSEHDSGREGGPCADAVETAAATTRRPFSAQTAGGERPSGGRDGGPLLRASLAEPVAHHGTPGAKSGAGRLSPVREALDAAKRWQASGKGVALATGVATRRSAARPLGPKLAVSESGDLAGSVSGGCVESDVAAQAREVLASGQPRLVSYGIADEDAWEVGLPCGGEIDVFLERVDGELPDPETAQGAFTVARGEPAGARG